MKDFAIMSSGPPGSKTFHVGRLILAGTGSTAPVFEASEFTRDYGEAQALARAYQRNWDELFKERTLPPTAAA